MFCSRISPESEPQLSEIPTHLFNCALCLKVESFRIEGWNQARQSSHCARRKERFSHFPINQQVLLGA
ncbi:unnamed protein product [Citrullus colocynthis]|uniref:Uncharacterized protein n=1 Tax=Citrullus colocynthis TaxID=252529 RepID=A0ABP0YQR3_9ROSI